jgi:hypothetical protein
MDSINLGLPVLWGCWPTNRTSWSKEKTCLVNPVMLRNDEASPCLYKFIQGDSLWLSNEQRWSLLWSRTELLAWISRIRRVRYFTLHHIDASIGWLLGDDCRDLDYSHTNYEKKEGVGPWKKKVIFFQTGRLYVFRWKKCIEEFPKATSHIHI